MNIHEFQAKALFDAVGIPVGRGCVARSVQELDAVLAGLPAGPLVVKAQIHAGGRGKGHFEDGFQGGVKVAKDLAQAREYALRMLGNTLITHQTGAAGRRVKTLYLCAPTAFVKEYYVAMVMDRSSGGPLLIASTEGGMDIEQVAAESPEKLLRLPIDLDMGVQPFQERVFAAAMGFEGELALEAANLLKGLFRLVVERDASLVEVNPLVVRQDGKLEALDAKVVFEDNALFRQAEIRALRDLEEEDPKEVEASLHGLSYVALDGNIACLVNGAGLAMATMDIIQHFGGAPANFLDVGGGATQTQVAQAFRIILRDPNVKGILVNIFGGIMSCRTIAEGIVAAAREVDLKVPLVVRLEGNEVAEGKRLLSESGIELVSADSLSDAALKVVELVRSANKS
jgi:succinyl-CoA synthetase beta subunit